ncbi:SdrD B-like domain-containing protein [Microcoleus sp. bin38.metabat.b11b12b14.051]|uniref:SdrD B-like domain-containing protein n=1 Tax=Microcoleus sp. bin38.metabat.b11b12b14.051 TaxID=2742709 RepID=UPI0025D07C38|nr:SdrD B-like domain-containing protein [Microcoleus sp. bin38.metabat.b11b12b14.051]
MENLTSEERIAQQLQVGNTGPAILGIKFNDLNADGIRQANEPGLANIPILLEPAIGSNGQLNTGDVSVLTDANGGFSFINLVPGNYVLTETTVPAGFRTTTPNPLAVTVGNSNVNVFFGNTQLVGSRIVGCKYLDIDADGFRDGNEPGIKNVRIYLDGSNGSVPNGRLDAGELNTLTDKNGAWSFNVTPGTYRVREERVNGINGEPLERDFPQSTPPNNIPVLDVTVAPGQTFACAQVGDTPLYQIEINKFRDIDRSGTRNVVNGVFEPPIANVPFILDVNGNGRFDTGEELQLTDVNGVATFKNLRSANYSVLEVFPRSSLSEVGGPNIPPGNLNAPVATTPNPALVSAPGPQARFQGTISREQPILVTDPSYTLKPNDPKFVDTNRDGFQQLGENSIAATGVRPIFANTPLAFPATNPSPALTFTPVVGNTGTGANSGVGNTRPNITVFKYNDLNGNGRFESTQGEAPIGGVTVFLDTNNNGTPDAGEQQIQTNAQGRGAFTNLAPGNYTVREVVPAGFSPSTTAAVPVTLSTQDANVTFANTPNSNITGCKFEDFNQNGYRDGNEPAIANVTVFLDTNNNGALDAGEATTTSDQFGTFAFRNLRPGTYNLREVPPPGFFQTTQPLNIVLGPNQTFTCALIGNSRRYDLLVPKFRDDNRNGIQDGGEPPLANIPFTLDLNRNGRYDAGSEPLVRTNAQGIALFPNLFPATYSVLEVLGDPSVPNDFQIATGPNPVSFNVPGPNTTPSVPLPAATPARTASSIDPVTGGTDMAATVSTDPLTNGGVAAAGVNVSADSLLAPETAGVMNVDFTKLKDLANSQIAFFMAEQGFDKPDLLLGAPTTTPLF